jgi:hypothetical protein
MSSLRDVNSITLAGVREMIPRIHKEQEKLDFDLCKLRQGEVAFKDVARIENLARRKSRFITKEMIEKNIQPVKAKPLESNASSPA